MRLLALLLLSGTILCGGPVLAQDAAEENPAKPELATPSALGVRQQRVIRMMQDLERKFTSLSQTLEKTEPERAERLIKAFQQSKQLLIEDRMASIVKLLNETRLDPASEQQGEIISDLKSLIHLLLEDDDFDETQEEIAQLEEWRERVQQLLDKERELRDESDRVNNKDQTLADLQQQIKALEGIIKKQEDVVRATESTRERGVASLGRVADQQHKVRGETEELADNVGGKSDENKSATEGEPGNGEPGKQPGGEKSPGGEKQPGGEKSAGGEKSPGGEKSGGEKSGGEKSGGEKSGGENSGGEKSGGEKSGGEKSGGEKSGGEKSGGEKSGGEKSGGEKSGGENSGGEKSGGEKSGGEKSGGEKSGGEKSGGEKSGGEKSGGEKSGGEKSGGQQSGGQQSGGQQSGEKQSGPSRPGEESLRKAAEHQKDAENELGKGKGEPAQADQEKALVELNKALEELKQEHSRIAKLPPEMFDELAKEQDKNSRDTGALEDEIAKAKSGEQGGEQSGGEQSGGEQSGGEQSGGEQSGGEQSGGQQSGGQQSGGEQSGGQQSGGQQPGQEDLKEAKQAMDKAADDLKKKDTSKAGKNQDEAIEKLKKAIKEIEERLAQLREETQLEKLARLEQRFREMLNLQETASKATAELDAKRDEDGKLKRSDRLALAKVAEAERVIAELARLAEEIIIEDGTSVVFPRVTAHLRTDLNGVAGLLDKQRTDKFTQTVQGDIEQTLRELIEALQKAQKQQEGEAGGGGGGGGGGGMEEPLLPSSAELKLLRSAQLRVNRRTKAIDEARDGKNLDSTLKQELEKAAQLQREITELAEEILEKF